MSANDLVMPKLGLTMTEGVLSEWHVAPGDKVSSGQVLFVVETDKLATEVEASGHGEIVELVAHAGETLPVGAVVARWTGESSAGTEQGQASTTDAPAPITAPAPSALTPDGMGSSSSERVIATPLARRIAGLKGVNLGSVKGSGFGGRIKARDVETAVLGARDALIAASQQRTAERIIATPLQLTVARRLSAAKREIPHFYLAAEADVGALAALRTQLNADQRAHKLSINHFILAAVARTWADNPEANRIWDDEGFNQLATVDVGMAVDTPRGLFAPVIVGAGGLTLNRLGAAADGLAERARECKLGADDLMGGAVTVSNVGMYGVTYLTPIVNPGQSAIVGVGTIRKTFRPDGNGQPTLRHELGLVLACDHRVFNGVSAAKLIESVIGYLEQPLRLLRA